MADGLHEHVHAVEHDETTAANTSCGVANVGPGELVVKAGKTRHSVASVITAANAPPLPAAWNSTHVVAHGPDAATTARRSRCR